MAPRKSPVRHKVSGYYRKGHHVKPYVRGSGEARKRKPKKGDYPYIKTKTKKYTKDNVDVLITGDTYEYKGALKRDGGYYWDGARGAWVQKRVPEFEGVEELAKRARDELRSVNGIRNRGNFTATVVDSKTNEELASYSA